MGLVAALCRHFASLQDGNLVDDTVECLSFLTTAKSSCDELVSNQASLRLAYT